MSVIRIGRTVPLLVVENKNSVKEVTKVAEEEEDSMQSLLPDSIRKRYQRRNGDETKHLACSTWR